jgi:hypothetical protein
MSPPFSFAPPGAIIAQMGETVAVVWRLEIPLLLGLGIVCGVVASVMQFRLLAQLNATRPADQQIRWYATGDYGTGWSVWKEHQRVFPQSRGRFWMVALWLTFAACVLAAGAILWFGE